MKNIDKILFKFKVSKLFLLLRFKDRKSDINDKRDIIKPSFKLNENLVLNPKKLRYLLLK